MNSVLGALKGLLQVKYIIKCLISHYSQQYFFPVVEHSSNLRCEDPLCEILLLNEENTVLVLLKFSVPRWLSAGRHRKRKSGLSSA